MLGPPTATQPHVGAPEAECASADVPAYLATLLRFQPVATGAIAGLDKAFAKVPMPPVFDCMKNLSPFGLHSIFQSDTKNHNVHFCLNRWQQT